MKQRFILYRRGEPFYCEDTTTGKQQRLRSKDANDLSPDPAGQESGQRRQISNQGKPKDEDALHWDDGARNLKNGYAEAIGGKEDVNAGGGGQ